MTCTAERHTVVDEPCPHSDPVWDEVDRADREADHHDHCVLSGGEWRYIFSISRDVCAAHAVVSGEHRHHDPETDAEWTDDSHGAVPDSSNRQPTPPSDPDCPDCKNTRWTTVRGMGNVPCPSCN